MVMTGPAGLRYMKNAKTMLREIVGRINLEEDPGEVRTIASLLLEKVTGVSESDVMAGRTLELTAASAQTIDGYVARINRHEPVQYVLGEAFFYGRIFGVNPSVLIPRPETEELVRTILVWKAFQGSPKATRIVDIGTGSGCIAITLCLEWPEAEILATDVSRNALALARRNAETLGATINFVEHDILGKPIPVSDLDVVVSNPPYIAENEKRAMQRNVLDFEPHLALFVPDADPLKFYRAISAKAREAMNPGGLLALEVNEKFGNEVCSLLKDHQWKSVDIVRDIAGKARVVRAIHS